MQSVVRTVLQLSEVAEIDSTTVVTLQAVREVLRTDSHVGAPGQPGANQGETDEQNVTHGSLHQGFPSTTALNCR